MICPMGEGGKDKGREGGKEVGRERGRLIPETSKRGGRGGGGRGAGGAGVGGEARHDESAMPWERVGMPVKRGHLEL